MVSFVFQVGLFSGIALFGSAGFARFVLCFCIVIFVNVTRLLGDHCLLVVG